MTKKNITPSPSVLLVMNLLLISLQIAYNKKQNLIMECITSFLSMSFFADGGYVPILCPRAYDRSEDIIIALLILSSSKKYFWNNEP
jgi:hypothetical protein